MPSLKVLWQVGAKRLEGSDSAVLDARLLLMEATSLTREALLMDAARDATTEELATFQALLERRAHHEPVAYILGRKEFWGLDFEVTHATLIPRPDSETLISASLSLPYRDGVPVRVLDLGTGTGCLLIALLTQWPSTPGIAVDISEDALKVAVRNAGRHGVLERTDFVCGKWAEALKGNFELIISNPPYIPSADRERLTADVAEYEPEDALFAGPDGLRDYRVLAGMIARCLAPGGFAVLEIGIGQEKAVAVVFEEEERLQLHAIKKDLAGIPRCMIWTTRET